MMCLLFMGTSFQEFLIIISFGGREGLLAIVWQGVRVIIYSQGQGGVGGEGGEDEEEIKDEVVEGHGGHGKRIMLDEV